MPLTREQQAAQAQAINRAVKEALPKALEDAVTAALPQALANAVQAQLKEQEAQAQSGSFLEKTKAAFAGVGMTAQITTLQAELSLARKARDRNASEASKANQEISRLTTTLNELKEEYSKFLPRFEELTQIAKEKIAIEETLVVATAQAALYNRTREENEKLREENSELSCINTRLQADIRVLERELKWLEEIKKAAPQIIADGEALSEREWALTINQRKLEEAKAEFSRTSHEATSLIANERAAGEQALREREEFLRQEAQQAADLRIQNQNQLEANQAAVRAAAAQVVADKHKLAPVLRLLPYVAGFALVAILSYYPIIALSAAWLAGRTGMNLVHITQLLRVGTHILGSTLLVKQMDLEDMPTRPAHFVVPVLAYVVPGVAAKAAQVLVAAVRARI